MVNLRCVASCIVCVTSVLLCAACETVPEWDSKSTMTSMRPAEKKTNRAEAYRTKFQTERDPKALNWILKNRLYSGMSLASVAKEMGEEGEYQETSKWLKATGGTFRTSDEAYKWGPDKDGRSVYLIFRENVLVNFDPADFELNE